MKQLFRNNYMSINLVRGIVLGVGESDGILAIMVGPLVIDINMYMFKKRARVKK